MRRTLEAENKRLHFRCKAYRKAVASNSILSFHLELEGLGPSLVVTARFQGLGMCVLHPSPTRNHTHTSAIDGADWTEKAISHLR